MEVLQRISGALLPMLLLAAVGVGMVKRVPVYDAFVEGAREGIKTALGVAPYLIAAMCAIAALRSSGLLDVITRGASVVLGPLGFPEELLPLLAMRPFSGAAATGIFGDLIQRYGADSYVVRAAGAMLGSTETIFYTLAVYCGAAGVKRVPFTVAASLVSSLAGALAAAWVCRLL